MSDDGSNWNHPSSRVSRCDLHANTIFMILLLLWATTGCARSTVMDAHPSDHEDMIQPRSLFPHLDLGSTGLKSSFLQELPGNGLGPLGVGNAYENPKDERYVEPRWLTFTIRTSMVSSEVPVVSEDDSSRDSPSGLLGIQEPLVTLLGDDLAPPRLPLRQSWSHHPAMTLLGNDLELRLPDSYILAHRDRVSSRPFRNYRAGFRDQPLLHPETSGDALEESKLPEISPPAHHSAKTAAILVAGSIVGLAWYRFGPESLTGVDQSKATKDAGNNYREGFTKPPHFDKDDDVINYLAHPLFGMQYYLSQRNYNESPLYSFLFSTGTSIVFEYLVEVVGERPSIQDLIATPVVGALLGELSYQLTQKMRKDGFTTFEKIVVTIVNPLYVLQNGYR
jgi:hypothetical protein